MLPQRQSQQLIEILSDESAKFDDSLKRFEDLFNRTEYFTVGWIVQHMIQHNLLSLRQRLVGLYILYEIYLHENVKTTPFYQLVLDLLSRADTLHVAEQKLLVDFLRSVPKVGKQTPTEFIREAQKVAPGKFHQDLEPYRKAHAENMPRTSLLHGSGIISVIRDDDGNRNSTDGINKKIAWSTLDSEELTLASVLPHTLRLVPSSEDSYIAQWISPEVHSEVMWDYNVSEESCENKLAKKAMKTTLSKAEETRLIEALKNNPDLAIEWGFTPDVVPFLVESCVELAYQIFYKLNHHPSIQDYYFALTTMPFSQHVKSLLLLLREQVEVPLVYVEAIVAKEIERQLTTYKKESDPKKLRKQQKALCELVIKFAQEEPKFIEEITEDDMASKIASYCKEFAGVQEVVELQQMLSRKMPESRNTKA